MYNNSIKKSSDDSSKNCLYYKLKRVMFNPILFAFGAAIILNIILPAIFPHLNHTLAIYHTVLHGAGLAISSFFSIIAIMAYQRVGKLSVFLMAMGFVTLSLSEAFYFVDASELLLVSPSSSSAASIESSSTMLIIIEVSHIASYAMLVLFSIGIIGIRRGRGKIRVAGDDDQNNDQFLYKEEIK